MKEVHPESGKCFHFDNGSHSPTLVSLLDSRQKEGSLRRKSARQPSFSTWVVASQTKVKESCVVSEATDTRHTRFIPWFLMRELKTSWRREEKESRLLRHTLFLSVVRRRRGNSMVTNKWSNFFFRESRKELFLPLVSQNLVFVVVIQLPILIALNRFVCDSYSLEHRIHLLLQQQQQNYYGSIVSAVHSVYKTNFIRSCLTFSSRYSCYKICSCTVCSSQSSFRSPCLVSFHESQSFQRESNV